MKKLTFNSTEYNYLPSGTVVDEVFNVTSPLKTLNAIKSKTLE